MKQFILQFVREEEGQDLVEYTLLLAFVCLASAALFINAGTSLGTIWTDANAITSKAAACAATGVS
jgi:Flp pilus assembly pilin Flp